VQVIKFRVREDQYARLRLQAAARRTSMARLLRQVLDLTLTLSEATGEVVLTPAQLLPVLQTLERQWGRVAPPTGAELPAPRRRPGPGVP
jgi:hypothetical protein